MADDTDDDNLWHEVTKSVTPLGNRPKVEVPKNTRPNIRYQGGNTKPKLLDERIIFGGVEGGDNLEPEKIHRREARRIARGTVNIDSTIDLHGANREQAYRMLFDHITFAYGRGDKLVLVITGKGGRSFSSDTPISQKRFADFNHEEGVLKKAIPSWLRGDDLNKYVSSYKTASKHHGGDGAVYVRLRSKQKE
ncbi:MAG: Smr/MutS family protein [Sphingomonadales bacterium]|nr:Smr/MutS family protein [Sphingomonadales bacterium]